jgi:predicted nucleotidyltransferase
MFNGELVSNLSQSPKIRLSNIILAFASGSYQHGARIEGKSDLDVSGVYIGTPAEELAIGNEDPRKEGHVTLGTSGQYEKNTVNDVDVKAYTLRRWAGLALRGNPNLISYLFVPDAIKDSHVTHPSVWDKYILPNRHLFLATSHTAAFLGLADSQYKRMLGLLGSGKHGQRDEVIEMFGWDCKAGMHMIRSLYECLELLRTGHMTFPRPEVPTLLDIREGKWSLERIKKEYFRLVDEIKEVVSPLPLTCDRVAVNQIIADAILDHWSE